MSQHNVEIVRRLYAEGLLDSAEGHAKLAEQLVEYVNPADAVVPGVRRGKEVADALGSLLETFDERENRLVRTFDAGEVVVAQVVFTARGATSGAEVRHEEAHTWTFENGGLVRFEWGRDLRSALEAAGLEEEQPASQQPDGAQRPRLGRAATEEDLPAVAACLTSAFHDDPLWGRWTFPDERSRPARLYRLMHFWAAAAVRYPWVRMTGDAEAVAVWIPPGEAEMTSGEEDAFATLVCELMGERAGELDDLFEDFDRHHPPAPHYYLSLWATHRAHSGRGIGSALMYENLARIDAEGMPAYLESTNPANLPRYEALGFVRTGEFGPAGGPVITTMWREARAL